MTDIETKATMETKETMATTQEISNKSSTTNSSINSHYITFKDVNNLCESLIKKIKKRYRINNDNDMSDTGRLIKEIHDSVCRYNTILSLYSIDFPMKTIEQHFVNLYNTFMFEYPIYYYKNHEYINFYEKLINNNSFVNIECDDDDEKDSTFHKIFIHNLSESEFLDIFNNDRMTISEFSYDSFMTIFLSYIYDTEMNKINEIKNIRNRYNKNKGT